MKYLAFRTFFLNFFCYNFNEKISFFLKFQIIELARAEAVTAETSTIAVPQANVVTNQPISNSPNEESLENNADESVALSPPPGFN